MTAKPIVPAHTMPLERLRRWLVRAGGWLDARGTGAWIALVVLGFLVFWPLGLVVLLHRALGRGLGADPARAASRAPKPADRHGAASEPTTGEQAPSDSFEAYRAKVIARLEQERTQYQTFVDRAHGTRAADEFDAFLDESAAAARAARLENRRG